MEQIISKTHGDYFFSLNREGSQAFLEIGRADGESFQFVYPIETTDGKDALFEASFGSSITTFLRPKNSAEQQVLTELLAEVTATLSTMLLSPREKI